MKNDSETLVIKNIEHRPRGRVAIYFNGKKKPYETDKRNCSNLVTGDSIILKKGKLIKK